MNFIEIKNSIKHLQKTCPCLKCKNKYRQKDITVLATLQSEGLFELKCEKCNSSTLVTVFLESDLKENSTHREHRSLKTSNDKISENDVLDIKIFLNNFDGNFKKLFKK